MSKAFSLLEIIFVLLIISIILSFFMGKFDDSLKSAYKTSVKAEISLIRNSINKINSKKILLNKNILTKLDEALVEKEKTLLFENILQMPLLSTNSIKKDLGKWIKTSSTKYKIYFTSNKYLEFEYKNNTFVCLSEINLCKEFE